MAHLAIVGSHSVNGVAEVHSELVKSQLVPDFAELYPERFNNKTNGVTPRRWLLAANPELAHLLTQALGDGWQTDLDRLQELQPLAEDAGFRDRFAEVKMHNKQRLARYVRQTVGYTIDEQSLFDVHVKRIHEYKRQLLNLLQIVHVYLALIEDRQLPPHPRTYLFAGKAAPGYRIAKEIIRTIHDVAWMINHDPRAEGHLKVVFLPDYRVTLAEQIIPAADISEQISTAGTEASGTSNMKFAMNGALTIGTLDGANIEIRTAVGAENFFLFGLTVPDVKQFRAQGSYHPWEILNREPSIRRVLAAFKEGRFSPREPGRHDWIHDYLLRDNEQYFHLQDLPSYIHVQRESGQLACRPAEWNRKAIVNVSAMGRFSSDRTIREYAKHIWHISPAR